MRQRVLLTVGICIGLGLPGTAAPSGGIVTSTGPWYFSEDTGDDELGQAVSTAGDVNGDGYSDVLIGAHNWDGPAGAYQGRALVFLGSASGPAGTPVWTGTNGSAGSRYGQAVSTAGDVNGDGYDDIVVGTLAADSVYVYHGSPTGPSPVPDTELAGVSGEGFGLAVNTAGDVNGDGYDDLLVGAFSQGGPGSYRGRVALYLGSASGLSTVPAWGDTGDVTNALLGVSVGAAGDVNADGYDDIIVGANGWDPSGSGSTLDGKAYCYAGNASGIPTLLWSYAGSGGEHLGEFVSGAGDVNGDGYADVLVGSPRYSGDRGRVDLFYGSASGPAAAPSWSETGAAAGDGMGPCATAGDVNGDGIADFMLSAPLEDGGDGEVRVYLGIRVGPHTAVWTQSVNVQGHFGQDLGTAGDVNDDGLSDIIVGSPYFDGFSWPDIGRAWVYSGCADDLPATTNSIHWGLDPGGKEGDSVADAGDVNGDGYADVLAGAPFYDDGTNIGGQVQLFYGSKDGADTPNPWIRYGSQTWERLGASVAGAGDVNGDGYSDFLVGDVGYEAPGPLVGAGRVDLYYGSAAGPVGPVWSKAGTQERERFGLGLDGAGDLNCDGYDDIIIGAPYYDGSMSADGRAEIYFGSATGPAAVPDWETDADGTRSFYGYAVCGAGDLNRDGFDDVIVGAPYHSSAIYSESGSFYIFLGSATGPALTWDKGINGTQAGGRLGLSVSGAGDVNADGYADFVVGEPYYDGSGRVDTGRINVYHGGPGLPVGAAFTALGLNTDDNEGRSVSSAGDVNGDGYSDIVSGAPYDGTIGIYNGRARLWTGSVNGIAGAAKWTDLGASATGEFGTSVSGAGDINGDGFSDVIVGEPVFSTPGYSGGRIAMYHGNGTSAPIPQYAPLREYAVQRSSGDPLQPGNLVNSGSVRLTALGWGPGGRTRVALEWEIAELGTPLSSAVFSPATNWTDSGPVSSLRSATPLAETVSGLAANSVYHVRYRVATRSPYFPHTPWLTAGNAADQLAHFKTGNGMVGVPDGDAPVAGREMLRAWPNPFRGGMSVGFDNPVAGVVRLQVFDAAGRLVTTPVESRYSPGRVTLSWDGRDDRGQAAASGVYFLRVEAPGGVRTAVIQKVAP